jgi:hypothetical protein
MLESHLDAIIWYVFEGAQCQISLIFFIITQMGRLVQLMAMVQTRVTSSFVTRWFQRHLVVTTAVVCSLILNKEERGCNGRCWCGRVLRCSVAFLHHSIDSPMTTRPCICS